MIILPPGFTLNPVHGLKALTELPPGEYYVEQPATEDRGHEEAGSNGLRQTQGPEDPQTEV
jgi:hypothetical protein